MPPQNDSGFGGISMVEYADILFRDLNYHDSSQRRGWLKLRFGKAYMDELTKAEQVRYRLAWFTWSCISVFILLR